MMVITNNNKNKLKKKLNPKIPGGWYGE